MSPETVCYIQIKSLAMTYRIKRERKQALWAERHDPVLRPMSLTLLALERQELPLVKAQLELECALYRFYYQVAREQDPSRE